MKERENYNRKLDETVQRILDREREYMEEQLLREKRENRERERVVEELRGEIKRLREGGGFDNKQPTHSRKTSKSTRSKQPKHKLPAD